MHRRNEDHTDMKPNDPVRTMLLLGMTDTAEEIARLMLDSQDPFPVIDSLDGLRASQAASAFVDRFTGDDPGLRDAMVEMTQDAAWRSYGATVTPEDVPALGTSEPAPEEPALTPDQPDAPDAPEAPAAPPADGTPNWSDEVDWGHPTFSRLEAFLHPHFGFGTGPLNDWLREAGYTNPRGFATAGVDWSRVKLDLARGILTLPGVGDVGKFDFLIPNDMWADAVHVSEMQAGRREPPDDGGYLPGTAHAATIRKVEYLSIDDGSVRSYGIRTVAVFPANALVLRHRPPIFRAIWGVDPSTVDWDDYDPEDPNIEIIPGLSRTVLDGSVGNQFVELRYSDVRETQAPVCAVMRSATVTRVEARRQGSGAELLLTMQTGYDPVLSDVLRTSLKLDLWFSFHALQGFLPFAFKPSTGEPRQQSLLDGGEDPDVTRLRETFPDRTGNDKTLATWVATIRRDFGGDIPNPIGFICDEAANIKGAKSIRRSARAALERHLAQDR